nr:unnamed protein product [Callosobruchus analis]
MYFRDLLLQSSVPQINSNIDLYFERFLQIFVRCFNQAFQVQTKIVEAGEKVNKKLVISIELKNKIKQLNELCWIRKRMHDEKLNSKYQMLKKDVNASIKQEKSHHFSNIISKSENKVKTLWSLVNEVRCVKKKASVGEIRYNGVIVNTPQEIANTIGNFISTVIDEKLKHQFPTLSTKCTTGSITRQSMYFMPVDVITVSRVIMGLPNKKSTGPDQVPISVIKENVDILAPLIAEVINISVVEGIFPDCLKLASVIVIHKKGDCLDIENYRPIALLSIFSKIIEKVVSLQIENYLLKFDIISDCQHGFRAGRSTETGIIDIVQYIYDKVDSGNYVVTIMFDLTRAFDTVSAEFVSKKIRRYGLRGPLNDWIISFLTNRKIFIKLDSVVSDIFDCKWGTPQGSVLGPLIFLLFINDLPLHLSRFAKTFLYADDTTIVLCDMSMEQLLTKIKTVVNEFTVWCEKNRLIINPDKTVLIEFHSKQRSPFNTTATIQGRNITASETTKLLGVEIDGNLSWGYHINDVCNKLSKCYYLLNNLSSMLNTKSLLDVYYAYCYPTLSYCINVWGQAIGMQRVFILQKRILRLIFKLPLGASCRNTFKNYEILTVRCIYLLKILSFTFKNKDKYLKHNNLHTYNTRYKDNLVINKHSHSFYKKSPILAGCQFFNLLPQHLKNCVSESIFKRKLKALLVDKCFYDLKEFKNYLTA